MDERWNAHVTGDRLFLHRSWTGLGIFEAQFAPSPGGGWVITEALVEGEPSRYRSLGDEFETVQLETIIRAVLLNEPAPELVKRLSALRRTAAQRTGADEELLSHHLLGAPRRRDGEP
jgi:hypothetical protein